MYGSNEILFEVSDERGVPWTICRCGRRWCLVELALCFGSEAGQPVRWQGCSFWRALKVPHHHTQTLMSNVTNNISFGDGAVSEGRRRETRTDGVAEGVPRHFFCREQLIGAVSVESVPHLPMKIKVESTKKSKGNYDKKLKSILNWKYWLNVLLIGQSRRSPHFTFPNFNPFII